MLRSEEFEMAGPHEFLDVATIVVRYFLIRVQLEHMSLQSWLALKFLATNMARVAILIKVTDELALCLMLLLRVALQVSLYIELHGADLALKLSYHIVPVVLLACQWLLDIKAGF